MLIKPDSIRSIRVAAASFGSAFTDIFTLPVDHPKNAFWRLIAKKEKVAIYDRSMGIFSHESRQAISKKSRGYNMSADEFNENMYMISNGEVIKIYGTFAFHRHRDPPEELILKFIKERFRQSFEPTDFKTRMEMIDFVLQAENNRLQLHPK